MTDHAEALAKALEVFAVMAKLVHPNALDKDSAHDWHIDPTVGQLRAARSALAAYRSRPAAEVVGWQNPSDKWKHFLFDTEEEAQRRAAIFGGGHRALYTTPALAGIEPAGEVVEDNPDFDGTDDAHPAWWRGNDRGVEATCEIITRILDGEKPAGVCREPLETIRRRIAALRDQSEA